MLPALHGVLDRGRFAYLPDNPSGDAEHFGDDGEALFGVGVKEGSRGKAFVD